MPKLREKKKVNEPQYEVNLSLGSGVARGYAHIAIIRSLNKHKIEIKEIAGCSIGSIVGAYYAVYGEVDSLETFVKTFKRTDFLKLVHLNNPKLSLIKPDKIKQLLIQLFGDKTFKDCKIPLTICATRIKTNKPQYFKSGKLVDAIMASICMPAIFPAYRIKNVYYTDGGITDPVPIKSFKNKKRKIIAIDLYRMSKNYIKDYSAVNVSLVTWYILEELIATNKLKDQENVYIIKPIFSKGKLDALDFSNYVSFYKAGENAIRANISKIKKWLVK